MTLALIRERLEVLLDLGDDLGEELVARRRALGDHPHDLVVDLGVQRREGEVLELPLEGVHAEPVGQRGVDVEGLAARALLRGGRDVAQRAHVVQPVGELDDQHPDVARHRHDHLADRLGLRRVAVLHLVELGDAVDEQRDLVAEVGAQRVEGVGRVLDRVVQQRRDQRRLGHADVGEDRGDRERVGDVGVAALAHLAGVPLVGDRVGALEEREVGLRVVGAHGAEERLEDRVGRRRAGADPGEAGAHAARGQGRLGVLRGCLLLCHWPSLVRTRATAARGPGSDRGQIVSSVAIGRSPVTDARVEEATAPSAPRRRSRRRRRPR